MVPGENVTSSLPWGMFTANDATREDWIVRLEMRCDWLPASNAASRSHRLGILLVQKEKNCADENGFIPESRKGLSASSPRILKLWLGNQRDHASWRRGSTRFRSRSPRSAANSKLSMRTAVTRRDCAERGRGRIDLPVQRQ